MGCRVPSGSALERYLSFVASTPPARHGPGPQGGRRFTLRRFTDEEWEEVTYLLADVAHDHEGDIRRPSAPDGGLDAVLLRRDVAAACLRGWQAKNFVAPLTTAHWRECRKSLERAITTWDPPHVTFVFPRDLSQKEIARFGRDLKQPHPERHVDWWGRAEIERRLNDEPHGVRIARRFLDEPGADIRAMERMMKAGGPVQTAGEALERQQALGELADGADPYFSYDIVDHAADKPPPRLADGAVVRLTRKRGTRGQSIDAVPRNSESLRRFAPKGSVSFPDEASATAFRKSLAEAGETQVTGFIMTLDQAPPFMREDLERVISNPQAVLTVRYGGAAVPRRIRVETDRGSANAEIRLQHIPPPPDWSLAFRLVLDTLAVTVMTAPDGEGAKVGYNWRLEPSEAPVRMRLAALDLLYALVGNGRLVVLGDDEREVPMLRLSAQALDEDIIATRRLFGDLVLLSDWTGEDLEPPVELAAEEVGFIAQLAEGVRRGRLPWTWSRLSGPLVPGASVPDGPVEFTYRGAVPVAVMGREVLFMGSATLRARARVADGQVALFPADPTDAHVELVLRPPDNDEALMTIEDT